MTPGKLIILRLFNITIGRFEIFSNLLKRFLIKKLILNARVKYVASSKFFHIKDLK